MRIQQGSQAVVRAQGVDALQAFQTQRECLLPFLAFTSAIGLRRESRTDTALRHLQDEHPAAVAFQLPPSSHLGKLPLLRWLKPFPTRRVLAELGLHVTDLKTQRNQQCARKQQKPATASE